MQSQIHNVDERHNASVTARPRIFFPAEVNDSFVSEVLGLSHRLREFTSSFFELGSKENRELTASVSKEDHVTFKALLALRCAYSANEPIGKQLLADAIKSLVENYPGDAAEFARVTDARKVARSVYPGLLEEKLKRARVIILRDFVPAIFSPNLSGAMFAFAAYRSVAVCLNCHKIFALDAERPDGTTSEKYCTAACGQRYRQKLYRVRVAQKSKHKERKR